VDDEPTPVMVVLGANDPTPHMTILVLCSRCRAEVTRREFDARTDDPEDARFGEPDARAWLDHRCQA